MNTNDWARVSASRLTVTQQTQGVLRREIKMLALPLPARHLFEPQLLSGGSDSPQLMGPLRGWRGVRPAGIQYLAGCLAVADLSLLLWLKLPLNRSHLAIPALPSRGRSMCQQLQGWTQGHNSGAFRVQAWSPRARPGVGPVTCPRDHSVCKRPVLRSGPRTPIQGSVANSLTG